MDASWYGLAAMVLIGFWIQSAQKDAHRRDRERAEDRFRAEMLLRTAVPGIAVGARSRPVRPPRTLHVQVVPALAIPRPKPGPWTAVIIGIAASLVVVPPVVMLLNLLASFAAAR